MYSATIPIFVNGNDSNTSENGSTIRFFLDRPIDFALARVSFKIIDAEIYYTFPNISSVKGNNQILFFFNAVGHTITLGNGLYNIDTLNSNIRDYCIANNLPEDVIEFTADPSTSKVSAVMANSNTTLTLGSFNDPGALLGWNTTTIMASNTSHIHVAPTRAKLNVVNRVLIHANFASGSYFNDKGNGDVVASVPINTSPGRQIVYQPFYPQAINVFSNHISVLEFYITDENNNRLDTNGEKWGLSGVFEYSV